MQMAANHSLTQVVRLPEFCVYSRCIFLRSPWVVTASPCAPSRSSSPSSWCPSPPQPSAISSFAKVSRLHTTGLIQAAPRPRTLSSCALRYPSLASLSWSGTVNSDPFQLPRTPRQHLSKEEVEEFVAPHPSSVDAVHEWLVSHGIGSEARHPSPQGIGSRCMCLLHRQRICLARYVTVACCESFELNYPRVLWCRSQRMEPWQGR